MKLISGKHPLNHYGQMAGTYELELHPCIKELAKATFDRHVHVGAGEGFYAVGLAVISPPREDSVAFETNPMGQRLIRQTSEINQVSDAIEVQGKADTGVLQERLERFNSNLLVIDVEGGEDSLLDPASVPALVKTTILVEIHHWIRKGFTDELLNRFASTHGIRMVDSRPRTIADLPARPPWFLRNFRKAALRRLVDENRGPFMQWALMSPLKQG